MNARYLAAAIAVLLSANAVAEDKTNFSANAGVGYSDNLARSATDEQGESIYTAGVALDWERDGSRLDGKLAAGLDWYNYSGDLFDDELLGRAIADLKFGFIPGRFDWVLVDTYGQTAFDPLQPVTEANRQNVNALSTGPDLTARFGSATFLQLSGRYNDVRYEESLTDYDGWSASLSLGRELSEVSSVRLVVARDTVRYANDDLFPDYDRDQVYLAYSTKGARTVLDASAGWSRASSNGVDDDSPMFKLSVAREMSARSTLRLSGEYGFATDGEVFSGLEGGGPTGPNTDTSTGVGDYAARTSVAANWNVRWTRTTFALGAFWDEEDYASASSQDVTRTGFNAALGRQITQGLTASLTGRIERREYAALDRDDDDAGYGLDLRQRIGRSWAATLSLNHERRSSRDAASEYSENRVFLRLAWTPTR